MRRIYPFLLPLAVFLLFISCNDSSTTPTTTTTTSTTTTSTTTITTTVSTKPVIIRETGEGFDTIGEAIDAAEAGQHIDVSTGTYLENLVIEKQLYLTGEDRVTTIIDGGGLGSVVHFVAGSQGSDIRGFTVRNSAGVGYYGIDCENVSVTIGRNIVKNNNWTGIRGTKFAGEISGVITENNGCHGILIYEPGSAPLITEVTSQGNLMGIQCDQGCTPIISSSTFQNNSWWGIGCYAWSTPDMGGGGSSPGNNIIKGNTQWDFYNNTPENIKAENNYWDHTIAADIDSIDIYDDDEDAFYGVVDFEPFLTVTSLASLRMKPRLVPVSLLFKDFFRSLFRADIPASAMYIPLSLEVKIRFIHYDLLRARYNSLTAERYYPPLMSRTGR